MRVAINVANSYAVKVRGIEVKVDMAAAKDAEGMVQRLFEYGLRKFNDASPMGAIAPKDEAGKKAFNEACAANAREMVKAWLAGDFEGERGGRVSDPVAARAREIAVGLVNAKFGRLGKDPSEAEKAERVKLIRDVAAKDAVMAQARKDVEAAAALADIL